MKSNKWFYFLILSIFLIITIQSFNCNSCFISNKKTIFVDGDNLSGIYDGTINHPFRTISDALSYANENDAIFIFNGLYLEKIEINKPISLIGENKKTTILDGSYLGTVIDVYANNVEITGITVRNSGPGFNYEACGIYVYADNVVIYDTIICGNYNGIHLDYSFESTSIYNNQICNNKEDGLIISHGCRFSIFNNEIFENGKNGCYVKYSEQGVIHNNLLESNEISGISLWESSDIDFNLNYLFENNEFGVYLSYSQKNKISKNTIKECTIGIYLYDSGGNKVSNNNFLENSKNHAFFNTFIRGFSINELFTCGLNNWKENYWDTWNGKGMYKIDGILYIFSRSIALKNFDLSPANKPFDYEGWLYEYPCNC
jgi:parallel beta-helix repeat protein